VKRNRRVKIVATLGPSSSTPEKIGELFECGVDVFRINMSHTSHDKLLELHTSIKNVETRYDRPIGILVDLQGPKLRVGEFINGSAELTVGKIFNLDLNDVPGDDTRVKLPHPEIFKSITPGDRLLINDGKIRLTLIKAAPDNLETRIEVGGTISNRKGVSLPDTLIPVSAMTKKDRKDLDYALKLGVDWIALSFVQRPEDVAEAKALVRGQAAIMVKLEKPSALNQLDEIVELTDGIMVARGDLGVEMPVEKVPGAQKRIITAARNAGIPVVVATQMLESMIDSPVPTRAEVSDVATAVYEGADAVMLSAESAAGDYPVEAVTMMDQIAQQIECDENYLTILHAHDPAPEPTAADAITAAARTIAETLNLAAIVCYTSSGTTGLRAARERPQSPIIALTPIAATGRRLSLVWGLHCVLSEDCLNLEDMVDKACQIAFQEGYAAAGTRILISAGIPVGTPGATNMLRVAFVGQDGKDSL